MRPELFYNPRLLCERLAEFSLARRRLAKLRGTVAASLKTGHIDSLELLELLRPHPPLVIYDVGANVGTWSLLAKAIFPHAQIHAFEPLPVHVEPFRQNTQAVDGLFLHEIGLGSQPARTYMNVTDFSDASSLLPLTETGKRQWHLQQVQEVPVQIHRLDDWIAAQQMPNPDLIKLDVQGYELEVLRGAETALAGVAAVLAEVSFFEIYRGQCLFHELTEYLSDSGFRLVALGGDTKPTIPLLQSEALFLSKELAAQLYENL